MPGKSSLIFVSVTGQVADSARFRLRLLPALQRRRQAPPKSTTLGARRLGGGTWVAVGGEARHAVGGEALHAVGGEALHTASPSQAFVDSRPSSRLRLHKVKDGLEEAEPGVGVGVGDGEERRRVIAQVPPPSFPLALLLLSPSFPPSLSLLLLAARLCNPYVHS